MSNPRFKVYAPLDAFFCEGKNFEISLGLNVKKFARAPDVGGLDKHIANDEWEDAVSSDYWLVFEWAKDDTQTPSDIIYLVLMSLWLVKPIRCQVKVHFELGLGSNSHHQRRYRHHERFMWVPGTIDPDFSEKELKQSSRHFKKLSFIYKTRGRLNDALLLTITGCWTHAWQSSIICHSAAVETILTYSDKPGISRRLAKSYACITRKSKIQRDKAFQRFKDLYSMRSDIVHGRTFHVDQSDRLPNLVRFQSLLRELWKSALSSKERIAALEDCDLNRKTFFKAVEQGYSPPQ